MSISPGNWKDFTTLYGTSVSESYVNSTVTLSDDTVISVKSFSGTINYNLNGVSSSNTVDTSGNTDYYIIKTKIGGNLEWFSKISTDGSGTSINLNNIIKTSDDSFIINGSFNNTIRFKKTNLSQYKELISLGQNDVFFAKINSYGDYQWVIHYGGTNWDSIYSPYPLKFPDDSLLLGISVDSNIKINSYDSSGNTIFSEKTITYGSSTDISYIKINSNGSWGWGTFISSSGYDSASSYIKILNDNSVIIANYFLNDMYFYRLDSSCNKITPEDKLLTYSISSNNYITKIDSSGNWAWFIQQGSSVSNILLLTDTTFIICGNFSNTSDFNKTDSSLYKQLISQGNSDGFIGKINSSGIWQWILHYGGINYDSTQNNPYPFIFSDNSLLLGLQIDSNIKINSYDSSGTNIFTEKTITYISSSQNDVVYMKINSNGSWGWGTMINSPSYDSTSSYLKVLNNNSIVLAGTLSYTYDGNPTNNYFYNIDSSGNNILQKTLIGVQNGSTNYYIAKIDSSGNWAWFIQQGASVDTILPLTDSSFIIKGTFSSTSDFNNKLDASGNIPTPSYKTLTSKGNSDIFIAQLDSSGVYQWLSNAGSSDSDSMNITYNSDSYITVHGKYTSNFTTTDLSGNTTYSINGSNQYLYYSRIYINSTKYLLDTSTFNITLRTTGNQISDVQISSISFNPPTYNSEVPAFFGNTSSSSDPDDTRLEIYKNSNYYINTSINGPTYTYSLSNVAASITSSGSNYLITLQFYAYHFPTSANTLIGDMTISINQSILNSWLSSFVAAPITNTYDSTNATFDFTSPTDGINCVAKGTKILTPEGEKLIENIKIGDSILTKDNRIINVRQVYYRKIISLNELYLIKKNSIGENIPNDDLYISKGHAIKINNKLYHPLHNKLKFAQKINNLSYIEFYHLQLENWITDFLVANNLEVESYGGGDIIKHRWDCEDECKLTILD